MIKNTASKNNIIFIIIEVIIGIILLFKPNGFTSLIIVALGLFFALIGAINTVNYFRKDPLSAMSGNLLSKGLLFIIIGLFCTFNYKWFLITFPVTTILYGAVMLLMGVVKFQGAIDCLRFKYKYWYVNLADAMITIISAVLTITNPFASTEFMWRFIAVALLVGAASDLISCFLSYKASQSLDE